MISADTLVASLPRAELVNWRTIQVMRIVEDSRRVAPGDLFVAISGVEVDAHRFVPDALRAGAVACVVERPLPELANMPTVLVPNTREALAYLHAALHGYPARKLKVIGVTGTEGKTTTVRLIVEILGAAGRTVGAVSTVSAQIGGDEIATGFHTTTPDAPDLQRYLRQMVDAGAEYAVIESTSQGLAQYRVAACEYDVAVITNVAHDHLDYHKTHDAYREAKAMLFHSLSIAVRKEGALKTAVLNADDPSFEFLRPIPADVQISYGLQPRARIQAEEIIASSEGLRFDLVEAGLRVPIVSPLLGRHNVHNILAAAAVARSQGVESEAIQAGVARVEGILGRMDRVEMGQPFTVLVDFAHTPNALEKALSAAREMAQGAVIVVFGCPGLRDREKRGLMGEVAGRLADKVIITADDPRTESLEHITEQVADGYRRAGRVESAGLWRIGDRREAIGMALGLARPGDVVLAAGKGHEPTLCIGETEHPWSEHDVVREGLARLGYG